MSDSNTRRPAGDDESAFHLEVTSLDGGQPVTPKPRRRWLRAAQGGAAFVVLVGLLYAFVLPHGAPVGSSPAVPQATKLVVPTPISYKGQPLKCPTTAAWSPDGAQVAVLYYLSCGGPGGTIADLPRGGALAVFSAVSDTPSSVLALDSLVIDHANVKGNAQELSELVIAYPTVDWSPDGQTIAVTYGGNDYTAYGNGYGGQGDPQVNGIILARPANIAATARVINQPITQGGSFSPAGSNATQVPAWDLATGQEETIGVTQGLAYRWGAGDTLQVTQALSVSAAPKTTNPPLSGPVGNPAGDATFSLWRAGQFTFASSSCENAPGTPDTGGSTAILLQLATNQSVWSPDGSLLIPGGLNLQGQVRAPMPPGALSSQCQPYYSPSGGWLQLPMRDAGLRAVLATAGQNQTTFYWRPDGQRIVAEQMVPDTVAATEALILTVYDCATGKVLATVEPPFGEGSFIFVPSLNSPQQFTFTPAPVVWSPDGQRLLVLGSGDKGFSILDGAQLGG